MSLLTDTTPRYSILDVGFGLNLIKTGPDEDLFLPPPPPEMANVFTAGSTPRNILAGELISDIDQQVGLLFNGKTTFDNTDTGYILGVDTSDSLLKFYIGNTTNYLNWTGTALNIAGILTASEIHIPDQDTTANSFHVNSTGDAWWGSTETNFNADNTNANAYVLSTGVARFASMTVVDGDLIGTSLRLGNGTTNGQITLTHLDGGGDSYIANGKSDFTNTDTGFILGIDDSDSDLPKFYIGTNSVYFNFTGSAITLEAAIVNAPVLTALASGSEIAIQNWQYDGAFSVTDADTVAWASGTLTLENGVTYSITGSNTGNMTALTYIYLDIAVSTTTFQTTTTASTAVGSGKILVATAVNSTDNAEFQMFGGRGDKSLLVDNISANSASTNEFVSNTAQIANLVVTNAKINDLDVSKLTAGTISSQSIVLAVTAGTGDVEIRAGIATGDFANSGAATGFIIGLDDSDSDLPKMYIGSSTDYIQWDGSAFTLAGVFTTLNGNLRLGSGVGSSITSGIRNTLLGENAGNALTEGNAHVIIGYNAGTKVTTNNSQVFIGDSAGENATSGGGVLVGKSSGNSVTTGVGNTLLGDTVGATTLATGDYNIMVGNTIDSSAAGTTNSIAIGTNLTSNTNVCVIGGRDAGGIGISTFYFGKGISHSSVDSITIRNTAVTGTNVVGGNLVLAAGTSTGSAVGGSILLQTSPAGGSGSSPNTLTTALTVDSAQSITLANSLYITEQADALADTAGLGQLWVDNLTPNILMFTDDAGTDQVVVTSTKTDISSYSWFLDEDDLSSDDATKVPSQQSVKAYVDAAGSEQNLYVPFTSETGGYTGQDNGISYVSIADSTTTKVLASFFVPTGATVSAVKFIMRAESSASGNFFASANFQDIADGESSATDDGGVGTAYSDASSSTAWQVVTIASTQYNALSAGRTWGLSFDFERGNASDTLNGVTLRVSGLIVEFS